MLATVCSASLLGIRGHAVTVEVHVSDGLPSFAVVGLPDTSCREARDRVRAAILSSDRIWPVKKVTVNLAPTGVPKSGAALDLAIAVGVLVASDQLPPETVAGIAFIAELGLDGSLRPVPGALPLTSAAAAPMAVVAPQNLAEAALVEDRTVRGVHSLAELLVALGDPRCWLHPDPFRPPAPQPPAVDLAQVQGQAVARKAIEVSAAGGHHLLLVGPPGAGKTMLAKALPALLPPLGSADALEVTAVHSAAGLPLPRGGLVRYPPFRAPHHTSSMVSLIGGGTRQMRPGEITCSNGGVLFLDELGEFPSSVLDALRQPLEEGSVRVARAYGAVSFPARFILAGATNPCPCGEAITTGGGCTCTDAARTRYLQRISGPLLDRFDLRIPVQRPTAGALFDPVAGETSALVAQRVAVARQRATARGVFANVALAPAQLDEIAPLTPEARRLLINAVERGSLSARGVHRVRCVARTLADLEEAEADVGATHVATALHLRGEVLALSPQRAKSRPAVGTKR